MTSPGNPAPDSFGEPRLDQTRRTTHHPRQRRNRRQYALPRFDFEDDSMDPLVTYGVTETPQSNMKGDTHTQRTQRYYSTQVLTPSTPVSPCLNATDRARRARRSRIRQPGDIEPDAEEVFCDITPLLREDKTESVAEKRRCDVQTDDIDEVPEIVLTVDEEMEGEYEFVERGEGVEMHNGTVRRWYRGFRY